MHDVRMIWWINYDFNWVRWLDEFHEHKISNTGWVWNGDEKREEWNGTKPKGVLNVFKLAFSRSEMKWGSRTCTCKLRGFCKSWQMYNLHGHVYGLHFSICAQNKAGKSMQWGEPSLKKGSALSQHKIWRNLLAKGFATLPPKTTTSLWNEMRGKAGIMQSD